MKFLGIEGTAWNASASVFDEEEVVVSLVSEPYTPSDGGIHPREASEHISSHLPDVISRAVEPVESDEIGCVAFSRGPGLGPCLRNVGTAARTAALKLDVPLVGVNHTLAHIEMGRWSSGFDDPVVLDAAGANTLITTFRGGRYRVVGETIDTGVGNAIDKFARHVDISHPGGPKIEKLARDGDTYVDLPYTVKGMDFSFSGIVNAAESRVDEGYELEDVAYSLQENLFSMLTEVAERGLALTRKDELVVGGGVSRNERLREMLNKMCMDRGAKFHAPEPRFLSDNAAMIAVTGARMYGSGQTVPVDDSYVKPDWRPDEAGIGWRESETQMEIPSGDPVDGAEAHVEFGETVSKTRLPKSYRCRELDSKIRGMRTTTEANLISRARRAGVPTPVVLDVDLQESILELELIACGEGDEPDKVCVAEDLSRYLDAGETREVGGMLANLHGDGVAHGDPTPRNFLRSDGHIYAIDFGLSFATRDVEDFAMDVYVFQQTLEGMYDSSEEMMEGFWSGYDWSGSREVKERFENIKVRGRYL
ncbi:MAG: bifunctional N(6)-L-threonylcarbamoyladenine synthase/serine/threonine protein kinase [Halobacteria archaeon]